MASEGNWDAAVAAYREALKKNPFDAEIKAALEGARTRAADQHYERGRRALKETRLAEALPELNLALALDPSRSEYHAALADGLRLRQAREHVQTAEKLRGLGRVEEAIEAYERAVELDPSLTQALESITTLTDQQRAEKAIGRPTQPITLRFQNARLKEVFEVLARSGGINVIFDKDVKDDPVTIFIQDSSFSDALKLILNTNGLFSRKIGPDTLLIVPNTKQKQEQYQDLMIRTFYLSNAKAKDVVNVIRTMLDTKRVYVNEHLNAVVMRDQPEKLRLAERIIQANDRVDSEVEFEVEVLEVNRTKNEKYGVNFPKNAGAGIVAPGGGLVAVAQQFTLRQLTSLGESAYIFSLPSIALLDFFKQESDAKTLASPKIRVANNKKATVNIGDKQPILLSTTNVLPGQAATGAVPTTSTVTSIEFKDTGVKLTIEPTVHLVDGMTLKMQIDVTRLGDKVTLQASPLIEQFRFGTRSAETTLHIKDGETVILAGLIQDEQRKTKVTIPGLGGVPWLEDLFSSWTTETVTTEVVLTLTPRIVRSVTMPGIAIQTFWSGTEGAYATEPMFADRSRPAAATTSSAGHGRFPSPPPPPAAGAAAVAQGDERFLLTGASPHPSLPALPDAREAAVALQPSEVTTAVGQEFALNLIVAELGGTTAPLLSLTFDPKVVDFRRAVPGAVLNRDGGGASNALTVAQSDGHMDISFNGEGAATNSGGVLATLFFRGKAPGASAIEIGRPQVLGSELADGHKSPVRALARVQ